MVWPLLFVVFLTPWSLGERGQAKIQDLLVSQEEPESRNVFKKDFIRRLPSLISSSNNTCHGLVVSVCLPLASYNRLLTRRLCVECSCAITFSSIYSSRATKRKIVSSFFGATAEGNDHDESIVVWLSHQWIDGASWLDREEQTL